MRVGLVVEGMDMMERKLGKSNSIDRTSFPT